MQLVQTADSQFILEGSCTLERVFASEVESCGFRSVQTELPEIAFWFQCLGHPTLEIGVITVRPTSPLQNERKHYKVKQS